MTIIYCLAAIIVILVVLLVRLKKKGDALDTKIAGLSELYRNLNIENDELKKEKSDLNSKLNVYYQFYEKAKSNLSLFPYMAGIVADFETRDLEIMTKQLDWGYSIQRMNKVATLKDIRKDTKKKIKQAKEAEYKLEYLLKLYPSLREILEYDYSELPIARVEDLSEEQENRDNTRDYLTKEEWEKLSDSERNQLALDRYVSSQKKTKWQVGRDYEEFVGYTLRKAGYTVDNYGSRMGLEDLGRDVIAKKNGKTFIIQCKYWSRHKEIHENHINQLFGTVISYGIEKNLDEKSVFGILITNTKLSETAKRFAERLNIKYRENVDIGVFPRIKCNIGHSEWGTHIYHLPFDQQYDSAVISNPGEFYAMTVKEAEEAGFRRAYKWHAS